MPEPHLGLMLALRAAIANRRVRLLAQLPILCRPKFSQTISATTPCAAIQQKRGKSTTLQPLGSMLAAVVPLVGCIGGLLPNSPRIDSNKIKRCSRQTYRLHLARPLAAK